MASVTGIPEVTRLLKDIGSGTTGDLLKELRKDMRQDLKPLVSDVETKVNSRGSGLRALGYNMFHNGRTAFSGAKGSIRSSVTRRGSLVKLVFTGRDGKLGFDYAELAGIERRKPRPRSKGWDRVPNGYTYNGQGLFFNEKLTADFGKPGRFAWINVIKAKPKIENKMQNIANKFTEKLNQKMKKII